MISREMLAALGLCVAMISAGQLLFKKAALSAGSISSLADLPRLVANGWLWAALVIYGAATFLWIVVLQRVPLSSAILFNSLCFVIVPVSAALMFGESLAWRHAIGITLIVAGLYVVAR